ncbi:DUF6159 family protein [uncultured Methanoregula sp.]|uniref:DUF6159 family protein n=1 Tax=uncultured Methanoregula sp. TaxID=1005933 RepID=UPI002AABAD76|nr:DUF6159 family protein [uncultured Methanoregula sp.]
MRLIFGIADQWLGLCRKPPVVHALQSGIGTPPVYAHEGLPDGGAGGSTIRRGIGSALSGMRTLNRNRQLLWFTLLAGLVLAGNIICQGALWYINWSIGGLVGPVLEFFIELATLFCFVFLLAGLVLSISSRKEGHASFFEGLTGAKKYTTAIIAWSFVLALAGMLLYRIFFYPGGFFWPLSSYLTIPLLQFPFTLNLNPSTFAEIPGYGGRSLLFWTYPYGFENALTFSAINLLLLLLTAFVVPLIVLEHRTLREAVVGSFSLMKKTWVEVATCALLLGIIVSGVFLTYLLVQAAHGMVTPPELLYAIPTGPWIALGILYYLALFSIAFVMATVGGIAALDLYRYAKTGQITGPEPHS